MPKHAEQRVLPFTADQMFDLVADVEHYPEFLPWCLGTRITKRQPKLIEADMLIGFKLFRERFGSRVTLDRRRKTIGVEYIDGPFRYLINRWHFADHPDGCLVDFFVDFEFRSRLLRHVLSGLFGEAVHRMVRAFEIRARELYSGPALARVPAAD